MGEGLPFIEEGLEGDNGKIVEASQLLVNTLVNL